MPLRDLVGLYGPSGVGKTTFIRYLLASGQFVVAPQWTTRQERPMEQSPGLIFVSPGEFRLSAEINKWLVQSIGGADYGTDMSVCRRLQRDSNVIVGLTAQTKEALLASARDMFVVRLWPQDFEAMQLALAASQSRPPEEIHARLAINERDRASDLEADMTVIVPTLVDASRRDDFYRGEVARLLETLEGRHRLVPDYAV